MPFAKFTKRASRTFVSGKDPMKSPNFVPAAILLSLFIWAFPAMSQAIDLDATYNLKMDPLCERILRGENPDLTVFEPFVDQIRSVRANRIAELIEDKRK